MKIEITRQSSGFGRVSILTAMTYFAVIVVVIYAYADLRHKIKDKAPVSQASSSESSPVLLMEVADTNLVPIPIDLAPAGLYEYADIWHVRGTFVSAMRPVKIAAKDSENRIVEFVPLNEKWELYDFGTNSRGIRPINREIGLKTDLVQVVPGTNFLTKDISIYKPFGTNVPVLRNN